MENLKSYVFFFMHQKDIIRNLSLSRIHGEEMKEMKDAADKSLVTDTRPRSIRAEDQEKFSTYQGLYAYHYVHLRMCLFKLVVPSSIWQSASRKRRVRCDETKEIRDDSKVSIKISFL